MFELERISDNQFLGRNYEGITKALYGQRINKHIIFYRIVNPEMMEITRILHQRMDLKKHIGT